MRLNITPENSVTFRVYDIEEIDGTGYDDKLTIFLFGEQKATGLRMKLKLTLDANGCNGLRVALSAMVDTGEYELPPDHKMEYGCYYMRALMEGIHDLTEVSFIKLPARTINDKDGKYDDLDDCAIFMRRDKAYDYKYLQVIIPTINDTVNAFENYEYIVFEFGMADEPETQLPWGKHCYTTLEKFRAVLNQKFPLMKNAEYNRHCYGYCKSSERGEENA